MPPLMRMLPVAPDGWTYYQDSTSQWWGMSPDGTHYLLWLIVPHRLAVLAKQLRRAAASE